MIARDVSYQPRLKTFETGCKNNIKTCTIKKITIPSHMGKTSLSVINSVHWRSGGEGEEQSCQLLDKQGEQANYSEQTI